MLYILWCLQSRKLDDLPQLCNKFLFEGFPTLKCESSGSEEVISLIHFSYKEKQRLGLQFTVIAASTVACFLGLILLKLILYIICMLNVVANRNCQKTDIT